MNKDTYGKIKADEEIKELILLSDKNLIAYNFTEHGFAHVTNVEHTVEFILAELNFDEYTIYNGKIAAYLHDIGNVINRHNHDIISGEMAFNLLKKYDLSMSDIAEICSAIGTHDKLRDNFCCSKLAAALILADKSDVRRSRVRITNLDLSSKHISVNYATYTSNIQIKDGYYILTIFLDKNYCSVVDFYSIYIDRMKMCEYSAKVLGLKFSLELKEKLVTE